MSGPGCPSLSQAGEGKGDGALKGPRRASNKEMTQGTSNFRSQCVWGPCLVVFSFHASLGGALPVGPSPPHFLYIGSWRGPKGQVLTPATPPSLKSLSFQACGGRVGHKLSRVSSCFGLQLRGHDLSTSRQRAGRECGERSIQKKPKRSARLLAPPRGRARNLRGLNQSSYLLLTLRLRAHQPATQASLERQTHESNCPQNGTYDEYIQAWTSF